MKLVGSHVDFDYGEEQMMAQHYRIENGTLFIGNAPYHTVLISGALTVRESTLKILREFLDEGGRVVFTGELPRYVDGIPPDACTKLLADYENTVYVEFQELGSSMAALNPTLISTNASEKVFNHIRWDGDDYISVWLNTDCQNSSGVFEVTFQCPDHCCHGYRAEIWVPETGKRYVYPHSINSDRLTLSTSLDAASSMILVFTKNAEELEVYPTADLTETGYLSGGEYSYTLEESNVAVLDYASYRFEGEKSFSELGEVLKIDQQIRDRFGIEHRGGEMLQPWFAKQIYNESYGKITLEYPFEVDTIPDGTVYLAAERPELQEYYCNGVRLHYESRNDWWVDNAFVKMEIPADTLKIGRNTITIVTDFKRTTNTEAVYLIGSFGVQAKAGASVITTLPATISLDDMVKRKLPFYSGKCTVEIPADSYLPQVDSAAEKIYIKIPSFTGTLVTVEYGGTKQQIAWEPYTADITEAVAQKLPLRITLVNSRRNSFGPLHIVPTIQGAYAPSSFLTTGDEWDDEYALIEAAIGEIRFMK